MRLDEKNLTKVGVESPYVNATQAVQLLRNRLGTFHFATLWRWVKFAEIPYEQAPGLRKAYRFRREDIERLPELIEEKKAALAAEKQEGQNDE